MTYVEIAPGEQYIFGVQTNLDSHMPQNIEDGVEDVDRNERIASESQQFIRSLDGLRTELQQLHEQQTYIKKLKVP